MHNLNISGDNSPFFYLYKTWVNQNHSKKNIWQDLTGKRGPKVPLSKRSRLAVHQRTHKSWFNSGK
jgi:hypothetical protein